MQPTQPAEVVAIRHLAPDVREMVLRPLEHPVQFKPGQWISVHLPIGDRPLVRAYTLAEPQSDDGTLVLCFDRVKEGAASSYLFELEAGARIDFSGPLGNFIVPDDRKSALIFVAWFTGIVPFRCMLLDMERHGREHPTLLVYGAPNKDELVYHDQLRELEARAPWFSYVTVGERAPKGTDRTIEDLLGRLPEAVQAAYPDGLDPLMVHPMIAGVRAMVLPAREWFMLTHGYERKQVQKETYD